MDILTKLIALLMYCAFICGILSGIPAQAQESNDMFIIVPTDEYLCVECGQFNGDFQTYQAHYNACATQNFQLFTALSQCVFVDPQPDCFDCNDGGGGCLWKPKAESNVGAVLLMPSEFDSIDANIEGAQVVRTVTGHNGNRKHWFFNRRGDSFGGPIVVEFSNGECLSIADPSIRND